MEGRRDAERIEAKAATRDRWKNAISFENIHRRVAEAVGQLVAQTTESKPRPPRRGSGNRPVEQSRLLDEGEIRAQASAWRTEIALKAEADPRSAVIEIDGRASTATENLKAEKGKAGRRARPCQR